MNRSRQGVRRETITYFERKGDLFHKFEVTTKKFQLLWRINVHYSATISSVVLSSLSIFILSTDYTESCVTPYATFSGLALFVPNLLHEDDN